MQSSAKSTGTPINLLTVDTMCFKEYLLFVGVAEPAESSFGRPKCDIKITLPPFFKICLMVATAAIMRVSSVTSKASFKGTLKSTRISARLF